MSHCRYQFTSLGLIWSFACRALEVKEILDRALAQPGGSEHPGLLHLYIHLMEMSSTPEAALEVSGRLQGLIPDAGHLNHMPSHIHVLCGDYRGAITSNIQATQSDQKYLARSGNLNFYSLYRVHNYHFLIYAAMFAGRSKVALEAMNQSESTIPEELLRIQSPPSKSKERSLSICIINSSTFLSREDSISPNPDAISRL